MDKLSLGKIRKQLIAEKRHILSSLKRVATENKKVKGHYDVRFPQYGYKKDENAREIMDFERLKIWEGEQELKLKDIEKALENIENGTYGMCKKCAEPIKERRLKALPAAQFCIFCANQS